MPTVKTFDQKMDENFDDLKNKIIQMFNEILAEIRAIRKINAKMIRLKESRKKKLQHKLESINPQGQHQTI